jgi:hypothetical protein
MRSMVEGGSVSIVSMARRMIPSAASSAGEDVGGRDPLHRHALCAKPCVRPRVALRAVLDVVTHPIDLDCEARLGAVEVEHIGPQRMLAAERRHSRRPRPEQAPQHDLRS